MDLLAEAREQAERSSRAVRAAALMAIARVETRAAPEQAVITLQRGIEEARKLDREDAQMMLERARWWAAAVDPGLLSQLPPLPPRHRHRDAGLYQVMMRHGHGAAVAPLLLAEKAGPEFPFHAVPAAMQYVDEATRRDLLRHAIAASRESVHSVLHAFQLQWKVLPEDEARDVVRELVRGVLEGPEVNSSGTYDREGTVRIDNGRENSLFGLLGSLRQLDSGLAESLIARYPQLAAAARRYPNGMDSVFEECRQRAAASGGGGGGYMMGGNRRDFPFMESMMQADRDGEFATPLQYALERYREDISPEKPNGAPLACWPSTQAYRSILYRAGRKLGAEAATLLDEIPQPDIRLLAQIELSAALVGLPEMTMPQTFRPVREIEPATPTRTRDTSGDDSGTPIRCPKCNWMPQAEDRWQCNCGHVWNTFDTGGVCPGCMYQWKVTQCLRCGEMSPHSDWYTHGS